MMPSLYRSLLAIAVTLGYFLILFFWYARWAFPVLAKFRTGKLFSRRGFRYLVAKLSCFTLSLVLFLPYLFIIAVTVEEPAQFEKLFHISAFVSSVGLMAIACYPGSFLDRFKFTLRREEAS
ncbi:MAG TPA: hypothetical protein VFK07_03115 [Candidatus Paceibacterota bacterium]|nr:hypothetical protein [Candidatus Paceibacterota bacterium]